MVEQQQLHMQMPSSSGSPWHIQMKVNIRTDTPGEFQFTTGLHTGGAPFTAFGGMNQFGLPWPASVPAAITDGHSVPGLSTVPTTARTAATDEHAVQTNGGPTIELLDTSKEDLKPHVPKAKETCEDQPASADEGKQKRRALRRQQELDEQRRNRYEDKENNVRQPSQRGRSSSRPRDSHHHHRQHQRHRSVEDRSVQCTPEPTPRKSRQIRPPQSFRSETEEDAGQTTTANNSRYNSGRETERSYRTSTSAISAVSSSIAIAATRQKHRETPNGRQRIVASSAASLSSVISSRHSARRRTDQDHPENLIVERREREFTQVISGTTVTSEDDSAYREYVLYRQSKQIETAAQTSNHQVSTTAYSTSSEDVGASLTSPEPPVRYNNFALPLDRLSLADKFVGQSNGMLSTEDEMYDDLRSSSFAAGGEFGAYQQGRYEPPQRSTASSLKDFVAKQLENMAAVTTNQDINSDICYNEELLQPPPAIAPSRQSQWREMQQAPVQAVPLPTAETSYAKTRPAVYKDMCTSPIVAASSVGHTAASSSTSRTNSFDPTQWLKANLPFIQSEASSSQQQVQQSLPPASLKSSLKQTTVASSHSSLRAPISIVYEPDDDEHLFPTMANFAAQTDFSTTIDTASTIGDDTISTITEPASATEQNGALVQSVEQTPRLRDGAIALMGLPADRLVAGGVPSEMQSLLAMGQTFQYVLNKLAADVSQKLAESTAATLGSLDSSRSPQRSKSTSDLTVNKLTCKAASIEMSVDEPIRTELVTTFPVTATPSTDRRGLADQPRPQTSLSQSQSHLTQSKSSLQSGTGQNVAEWINQSALTTAVTPCKAKKSRLKSSKESASASSSNSSQTASGTSKSMPEIEVCREILIEREILVEKEVRVDLRETEMSVLTTPSLPKKIKKPRSVKEYEHVEKPLILRPASVPPPKELAAEQPVDLQRHSASEYQQKPESLSKMTSSTPVSVLTETTFPVYEQTAQATAGTVAARTTPKQVKSPSASRHASKEKLDSCQEESELRPISRSSTAPSESSSKLFNRSRYEASLNKAAGVTEGRVLESTVHSQSSTSFSELPSPQSHIVAHDKSPVESEKRPSAVVSLYHSSQHALQQQEEASQREANAPVYYIPSVDDDNQKKRWVILQEVDTRRVKPSTQQPVQLALPSILPEAKSVTTPNRPPIKQPLPRVYDKVLQETDFLEEFPAPPNEILEFGLPSSMPSTSSERISQLDESPSTARRKLPEAFKENLSPRSTEGKSAKSLSISSHSPVSKITETRQVIGAIRDKIETEGDMKPAAYDELEWNRKGILDVFSSGSVQSSGNCPTLDSMSHRETLDGESIMSEYRQGTASPTVSILPKPISSAVTIFTSSAPSASAPMYPSPPIEPLHVVTVPHPAVSGASQQLYVVEGTADYYNQASSLQQQPCPQPSPSTQSSEGTAGPGLSKRLMSSAKIFELYTQPTNRSPVTFIPAGPDVSNRLGGGLLPIPAPPAPPILPSFPPSLPFPNAYGSMLWPSGLPVIHEVLTPDSSVHDYINNSVTATPKGSISPSSTLSSIGRYGIALMDTNSESSSGPHISAKPHRQQLQPDAAKYDPNLLLKLKFAPYGRSSSANSQASSAPSEETSEPKKLGAFTINDVLAVNNETENLSDYLLSPDRGSTPTADDLKNGFRSISTPSNDSVISEASLKQDRSHAFFNGDSLSADCHRKQQRRLQDQALALYASSDTLKDEAAPLEGSCEQLNRSFHGSSDRNSIDDSINDAESGIFTVKPRDTLRFAATTSKSTSRTSIVDENINDFADLETTQIHRMESSSELNYCDQSTESTEYTTAYNSVQFVPTSNGHHGKVTTKSKSHQKARPKSSQSTTTPDSIAHITDSFSSRSEIVSTRTVQTFL